MARETPAQKAQQDRAWYIARLRGLYESVTFIQDQERRSKMQELVEEELKAVGAESQASRKARIAELNRKWMEGDEEAGRKYRKLTKPLFQGRNPNKIPF